jgi:hypothetical protein
MSPYHICGFGWQPGKCPAFRVRQWLARDAIDEISFMLIKALDYECI